MRLAIDLVKFNLLTRIDGGEDLDSDGNSEI
jgi:hypothetical protein